MTSITGKPRQIRFPKPRPYTPSPRQVSQERKTVALPLPPQRKRLVAPPTASPSRKLPPAPSAPQKQQIRAPRVRAPLIERPVIAPIAIRPTMVVTPERVYTPETVTTKFLKRPTRVRSSVYDRPPTPPKVSVDGPREMVRFANGWFYSAGPLRFVRRHDDEDWRLIGTERARSAPTGR